MGFKEDIQRLSVQIADRKTHIINEEMGKQSLIIPFLQVLGFDVFNPLEVRPEYTADFGIKKGERVDYAVFKDGTPVIFIEAKALSEKLENHDSQLARYFNSTPEVKLAVITNGVEYKFFTDLEVSNVMDPNPFLKVDITNLTENDIESLSRFRKEEFEKEKLITFAEELIYTSNLNKVLEDLFKNPSDDFVRFLIRPFSSSKVTANVIERFKPIVKKSISTVLLKMVSQGLFPQEADSPVEEPIQPPKQEEPIPTDSEKAKPVTTEEELRAFEIIKEILIKAGKSVNDLSYKDTLNYFGIHNRVTTNWIFRFLLDSTKKNIITKLPVDKVTCLVSGFIVEEAPRGFGISRIYINSVEDILQMERLIIECFDDVVR